MGVRFEPGPNLDFLGVLGDTFDHLIVDSFLHIQSGTGAAALPVVEEDGAGGSGNCGFKIGVSEDHVGRLPAQFQRYFLQVACCRMYDQLSDFRRAGEGDLIHVGMGCQRGSGGLAVSGHDIHHAFGESGFQDEFAETQRGEWSLLRRLQHDRAARCQGRPQLPDRHQQREIPWNDLSNYTDRFPQSVGEILRPGSVGD